MPLGALVAVTAVSGAFVAGMQAGHHFNTFPLMDGRLVPEGYGAEMQPLWRNFFEHIPTVQFDHRLLATSTALGVVALWGAAMRQGPALPAFVRQRLHAMLAATGVQFTRESSSGQPSHVWSSDPLLLRTVGVATLLSAVPVHLGSAHQTGALTLFTIVLFVLHGLRRAQSGQKYECSSWLSSCIPSNTKFNCITAGASRPAACSTRLGLPARRRPPLPR